MCSMSNITIMKILTLVPSTSLTVMYLSSRFHQNIYCLLIYILYNIFQYKAVASWLTKNYHTFLKSNYSKTRDNPSCVPLHKLKFIPISLYKKFEFEMLVGPRSN